MDSIPISVEGFRQLERELERLKKERPAVILAIKEAREEGDLRENAGYDAARERQGMEIWKRQRGVRLMKIQTNPLSGLTQSQDVPSKAAATTSEAFASILAKEVGSSATQETGLAAPVLRSAYGALALDGNQGGTDAIAGDTAQGSGGELAAMALR